MRKKYIPDVEAVPVRQHDNDGDVWASADGRLSVGEPFRPLTSLLVLHELKVARTHEALRLLESRLDARGRVVVERPNRGLAELSFGAVGCPSELARARYREIAKNLGR